MFLGCQKPAARSISLCCLKLVKYFCVQYIKFLSLEEPEVLYQIRQSDIDVKMKPGMPNAKYTNQLKSRDFYL